MIEVRGRGGCKAHSIKASRLVFTSDCLSSGGNFLFAVSSTVSVFRANELDHGPLGANVIMSYFLHMI